MRKILRVEAPHFVAGAVYEQIAGSWHCVFAAPILQWAVGKPPHETRDYIKRKGWKFVWVTMTDSGRRI
jgi:predicted dithiol-disulfide oxidoreductase (DUF899 family)